MSAPLMYNSRNSNSTQPFTFTLHWSDGKSANVVKNSLSILSIIRLVAAQSRENWFRLRATRQTKPRLFLYFSHFLFRHVLTTHIIITADVVHQLIIGTDKWCINLLFKVAVLDYLLYTNRSINFLIYIYGSRHLF